MKGGISLSLTWYKAGCRHMVWLAISRHPYYQCAKMLALLSLTRTKDQRATRTTPPRKAHPQKMLCPHQEHGTPEIDYKICNYSKVQDSGGCLGRLGQSGGGAWEWHTLQHYSTWADNTQPTSTTTTTTQAVSILGVRAPPQSVHNNHLGRQLCPHCICLLPR